DHASVVLEHPLKAADDLVAVSEIRRDGGDLSVLERVRRVVRERVAELPGRRGRPHEPRRRLSLGQILSERRRRNQWRLRVAHVIMNGESLGARNGSNDDLDALALHQLFRLGLGHSGRRAGVQGDDADVESPELLTVLLQVIAEAVFQLLADSRIRATLNGEKPNLELRL